VSVYRRRGGHWGPVHRTMCGSRPQLRPDRRWETRCAGIIPLANPLRLRVLPAFNGSSDPECAGCHSSPTEAN